jgi:hypothetical protein
MAKSQLPKQRSGEDASREAHRFHLWFEQFRDIALMALALAGGGITLLGSVFASSPKKASAFVAIIFFSASAVTALYAQSKVVEHADEGTFPGEPIRRLRSICFALMGGGCGAFLTFTFLALRRAVGP